MLNQKGSGVLLGILIGLLIAGGLFGVYYIWKTQLTKDTSPKSSDSLPQSEKKQETIDSPEATQNPAWMTYTNTIDGYTVGYPQNIAEEKIYLNSPTTAFISNQQTLPIPFGKIFRQIFISVESNENKLSAKEYVDQILQEKDASGDAFADNPALLANIKRQAIIVGGESGEQVEGLPAANFRIDIFVPYKDKMYKFALDPSVTDNSTTDQEWQKAFTKILSTFKFTN